MPVKDHGRTNGLMRKAHGRAVRATLDWMEETMLCTAGRKGTSGEAGLQAGGMVAALFQHMAGPGLEPDLHTHVVLANLARDGEGRWRAVDPKPFAQNGALLGAMYCRELARILSERGYSLRPTLNGWLPGFELAGMEPRFLEGFCTKRRRYLFQEREWDSGKARKRLEHMAGEERSLTSMLLDLWGVRLEGIEGVPAVRRWEVPARSRAVKSALEAAFWAKEVLQESRGVFPSGDLDAAALGRFPGRHSIEAVREEVAALLRDWHLVEWPLPGAARAFGTDDTVRRERRALSKFREGRDVGGPLAGKEKAMGIFRQDGIRQDLKEAIWTILRVPDMVVGIECRGTSGVYTVLRCVRDVVEGRRVVGVAPSGRAARALERETGIHGRELRWFIDRPLSDRLKEHLWGAVLVVMDAGKISAEQMLRLMTLGERCCISRLILVGDRDALEGLGSRQIFRVLQSQGMSTAIMDRFGEDCARAVPEAAKAVLLRDDGSDAAEIVGSSFYEVSWDMLGKRAVEIWLELDPAVRAKTRLAANTRELRADINAAMRENLEQEGVLKGAALEFERFESLGLTPADKTDVRAYCEGDVVVFHYDLMNFRIEVGDALVVTGVEEDRVLMMHADGKPRHIRPAPWMRYRLDVYESCRIEVRAGDRIVWTRGDEGRNLKAGEEAEVKGIGRGRVRFALKDGTVLSLAQDDLQLRYLDHVWGRRVEDLQGAGGEGAVVVLDLGLGEIGKHAEAVERLSKERPGSVFLMDDIESVVGVLEDMTGDVAHALGVDHDDWPDKWENMRIPEKEPLWFPDRERAALEEKAWKDGTVLFRVDGYETLIARTRRLARSPSLRTMFRDAVDGLLEYDRNCRESDGQTVGLLKVLKDVEKVRDELEASARSKGCSVPNLEEYEAWRRRANCAAKEGMEIVDRDSAWGRDNVRKAISGLVKLDGLLLHDDDSGK